MRLEALVGRRIPSRLTTANVVGVDIGSRTANAVLVAKGEVFTASTATHVNMQTTTLRTSRHSRKERFTNFDTA